MQGRGLLITSTSACPAPKAGSLRKPTVTSASSALPVATATRQASQLVTSVRRVRHSETDPQVRPFFLACREVRTQSRSYGHIQLHSLCNWLLCCERWLIHVHSLQRRTDARSCCYSMPLMVMTRSGGTILNSRSLSCSAPGWFSPVAGSLCQPCTKGSYQPVPGQGFCVPCAPDTRTTGSNATVCERCPNNAGTAGQAGASACLCNNGELSIGVRWHETLAALGFFLGASGGCAACPRNSNCGNNQLTPQGGFWAFVTADGSAQDSVTVWPCPSGEHDTRPQIACDS